MFRTCLLIFALLQALELQAEDEAQGVLKTSGEDALEGDADGTRPSAQDSADLFEESDAEGDDEEGGGDEYGDDEEGDGDDEEGDSEEGGDEGVPALTEQQVSSLFENMGEASRQEGAISTQGIHLDEAKAFIIKMEAAEAEAQVLDMTRSALESSGSSDENLPLEKVVELYGEDGDSEGWAKKIKAADVDGDGLFSKEELMSLHLPRLNKDVLALFVNDMLSEMDLDRDGKVSLEEYEKDQGGDEQFKEHFVFFDQDNDGFLAGSELENLDTEKFRDQMAIAHMVQIADTDQDGYVTLHEFLGVSLKIHEEYHESTHSARAHDQFLRWGEHLEL